MSKKKIKARVALIMGSESDWPVMRAAADALKKFKIAFVAEVVSAHRTPEKMAEFATDAEKNGLQVIIAGAGGAAHLPGMVAAYTTLPVVGVPVPIGHLAGQDALYSIVQMPKGVPVAAVAIGNAWNAGVLAARILASNPEEKKLAKALEDYRLELRQQVKNMRLKT